MLISRVLAGLAAALVACAFVSTVYGIAIDWTPIGDPGNLVDSTGHGFVGYSYQIDKYEITNSQYMTFLNAVARADPYGLYSPSMASSVQGGITRSGASGSFTYDVKAGYEALPVNFTSWADAARFCNWMANNQPTGGENLSTTEDGSYYLNGATTDEALISVVRDAGASVVIPTENEWYKAAYFDPATSSYYNWPTSAAFFPFPKNNFIDTGNNANFGASDGNTNQNPPNLTPVGHFALSHSPFGTFDQGGNVAEWNESLLNGAYRGMRGGSWGQGEGALWSHNDYSTPATNELDTLGFRIALVPEPSGAAISALGALIWACLARRGFLRDNTAAFERGCHQTATRRDRGEISTRACSGRDLAA